MCLRTALHEREKRIEELEAANKELKEISQFLWLAQFAPLCEQDKRELNALMRKHGIEVYP